MKKVTVIGGGTGTFVVLSGLKAYELDLAAIVTMMDSGGSTGRLRDQLGVLPPGDLRQCMVALSEASGLWRELFLYRFEHGDLKGHNFGNIFLSALEKVSKNYDEAIETVSYVLKTKGHVMPVTFGKADLCVRYESGKIIKGETHIDEDNPEKSKIVEAYLEPKVDPNPKAVHRLLDTDYIIIGPGDLYTSIIPVLIVDDLRGKIRESKATIIYVMNMVTKSGQTTDYTAMDHVKDAAHYLGRMPDVLLINNGKVSEEIITWYESHNEHQVEDDITSENFPGTVIRDDFVDRTQVQKPSADQLTRSILRHDSHKVARALVDKVFESK